MSYNFQVALISISIYIFIIILYYLFYLYYINLENKKFKFPDLKYIIISLLFVLLIVDSTLIINNYRQNNNKIISKLNSINESYLIDLPNSFKQDDMNIFFDSIKQKIKPDDGVIYASSPYQHFELNDDLSIRVIFLEFYIIRDKELIYFEIYYDQSSKKVNDKNQVLVYRRKDNNEYQQINLEEVFINIDSLNLDQVKENLDFTESEDLLYITIYAVPSNYEYSTKYIDFIVLNKEGNIIDETDENLNSNNYIWYDITKMDVSENGRFTSERLTYYVKK